jgi:predicted MPP superfamily phosphohydrolase
MVLIVAVGIPVPLLWALGRLIGHATPFVVAAVALTLGFLSGMANRSAMGEPSKLRLYGLMWPFFVYWTGAFLFAFIAPFVVATGAVLSASLDASLRAALAVAGSVTLLAFIHRLRIHQRDVVIPSLPQAFDGYRIVQLTDLHCGPFASGRRVEGWVARANRLNGDLIAVTGDLIASGSAFVSVVAGALGGLRAPDGVYAAMGNHDYFTDGERMADALVDAGLDVLRNRGVEVQRDGARLFVAGVDDTWTGRNDVDKALEARPAGVPAVLLAHDPALFPEAAARGVELTLSGHTHGGQLGVPFFQRRWNLARMITGFTSGFYKLGESTLFVSHGLGTTGVPIRLLVPPEIAVITLRRAA